MDSSPSRPACTSTVSDLFTYLYCVRKFGEDYYEHRLERYAFSTEYLFH